MHGIDADLDCILPGYCNQNMRWCKQTSPYLLRCTCEVDADLGHLARGFHEVGALTEIHVTPTSSAVLISVIAAVIVAAASTAAHAMTVAKFLNANISPLQAQLVKVVPYNVPLLPPLMACIGSGASAADICPGNNMWAKRTVAACNPLQTAALNLA